MGDLKENGFDYVIISPRFLYLSQEEKPLINALLKSKPAFETKSVLVIPIPDAK